MRSTDTTRRNSGATSGTPRGTARVSVRTARPRAAMASAPRDRVGTDVLFNLLADRTRRRLLDLLLDEREICVCRLAEAVDASQPKISRHLAVLRESGVLVSRRNGNLILYRLDPDLPGWAVRVISMMADGAKLEPYHADDRTRLAHAKVRGKAGAP